MAGCVGGQRALESGAISNFLLNCMIGILGAGTYDGTFLVMT